MAKFYLTFFLPFVGFSLFASSWPAARNALQNKKYQEAIRIYSQLCREPMGFDCNNELGIAYLGIGNARKARNLFFLALEQKTDARVMTNLARALYVNNELQKADRHYRDAYALSPNNLVVGVNYAIYLLKISRREKAHNVLLKMAKLYPNNFFVRLYLGISYYLQRDYVRAEAHLSQGIAFNANYADLYYHRALVFYVKREYGRALIDLERAKILNPVEFKIKRMIRLIKKKKKI
ncbi:MAG: tetratricopeptide repeat protein [Spirochaetota bacterium]